MEGVTFGHRGPLEPRGRSERRVREVRGMRSAEHDARCADRGSPAWPSHRFPAANAPFTSSHHGVRSCPWSSTMSWSRCPISPSRLASSRRVTDWHRSRAAAIPAGARRTGSCRWATHTSSWSPSSTRKRRGRACSEAGSPRRFRRPPGLSAGPFAPEGSTTSSSDSSSKCPRARGSCVTEACCDGGSRESIAPPKSRRSPSSSSGRTGLRSPDLHPWPTRPEGRPSRRSGSPETPIASRTGSVPTTCRVTVRAGPPGITTVTLAGAAGEITLDPR